MSWDVLLLRAAPEIRSIDELPNDYSGESLGTPTEVAKILRELFPHIDLRDPAWGVLEHEEYSIEFNIGDEVPCTSVTLHIRGPESAIEPLRLLCKRTGWLAFDTSDGELIDFATDPAKGLRDWIAYRQQAGIAGPLRGVSLPVKGKGVVFFDALPDRPAKKKRSWWQFWR